MDTSKWVTYRVVLYPILQFLCVKSVYLRSLWCVPAVSMLYWGILAHEVWQRLEKLHLIQSRSRVLQLKQQFQTLKKGGLSITEYLDKMKGISDALEAIRQPVMEFDLCNQILNGLGPEYDSVHTAIATRDSPITFEDLFGQLLTFELRLELHHSSPITDPPTTALYTATQLQGRSGSRGRSNYRGRGRGRNNSGRGGYSSTSSNQSQSTKAPLAKSAIEWDILLLIAFTGLTSRSRPTASREASGHGCCKKW